MFVITNTVLRLCAFLYRCLDVYISLHSNMCMLVEKLLSSWNVAEILVFGSVNVLTVLLTERDIQLQELQANSAKHIQFA